MGRSPHPFVKAPLGPSPRSVQPLEGLIWLGDSSNKRPPLGGTIKPSAMRVVVDFMIKLCEASRLAYDTPQRDDQNGEGDCMPDPYGAPATHDTDHRLDKVIGLCNRSHGMPLPNVFFSLDVYKYRFCLLLIYFICQSRILCV